MSYLGVFNNLKEVFPQVDVRILKAVAIEHYNDANAAVEFVLSDVLPSLSGLPESSYKSCTVDNPNGVHALPEVDQRSQGSSLLSDDEEACGGPFVRRRAVSFERMPNSDPIVEHVVELNALPNSDPIVEHAGHQEATGEELDIIVPLNQTTAEHGETNPRPSDTADGPFHVQAPYLDEAFAPGSFSSAHGENIQRCNDSERGDFVSSEKDQFESDQSPASRRVIEDEHTVTGMGLSLPSDKQVLHEPEAAAAASKSNCVDQHLPSSFPKTNLDFSEHGLSKDNDAGISGRGYEEPSEFYMKNDSEPLSFNSDVVTLDNKFYPSTIATRYGQVISIDELEDFINDAKSNKKMLLSAMESVANLVKEVEHREKEAIQAKEDASKAGLDILSKVEELKQMLVHAKEANYMHAGEVYGEKSILVTEARELQARLLSSSDERNRSLSIIEEMSRTLEARLAAAEAERVAAEEEKLKKEAEAHKLLHEQEIVMDKIAQESKKLQQEAEQNSKLREFLMDRGCIVDTLQGEIAVICEDVMSLKKIVDGHATSNECIQSSQTSLASSSTSQQSTTPAKILEPVKLSDSPSIMNQEFSESQYLECSKQSVETSVAVGSQHLEYSKQSTGTSVAVGGNREDDWDMFDDAFELHN